MEKTIISLIVLIVVIVTGWVNRAMAQSLPQQFGPFPGVLRIEGVWRPAAPAAGFAPAKTKTNSPAVDFEPAAKSWNITNTISPFGPGFKFLTPFITLSNSDKSTPSLSGLRVGSGVSFFLPVSQHLSAFAQINPSSPQKIFTAPHTIVMAGFQIPLIEGTPTGGNLSLKFSTALDPHFRPIITFTLTTTPFTR